MTVNVITVTLAGAGKLERETLKEDDPSYGMLDGDNEITLIGPVIGAKEVNTKEAFKLAPVTSEYTNMVFTEDAVTEGDWEVTEKLSEVAE